MLLAKLAPALGEDPDGADEASVLQGLRHIEVSAGGGVIFLRGLSSRGRSRTKSAWIASSPRGRVSPRIASMPVITGIWLSITMRSKPPLSISARGFGTVLHAGELAASGLKKHLDELEIDRMVLGDENGVGRRRGAVPVRAGYRTEGLVARGGYGGRSAGGHGVSIMLWNHYSLGRVDPCNT